MPVSKESRRARHEQAESPTLDKGNPSATDGRVGTQQFRQIAGKGLVHLVRDKTGWKEMGVSQSSTSKGDKSASSVAIAAGISASDSVSQGTSFAGSSHSSLTNLAEDDHTHYVHNTTQRTITANHAFTGIPTFSNIDINGGTINGITDLAIVDGGTGVSSSDIWLNSRITTKADGTLNYDATSAVAPNHDSLAGFVSDEHIDHTSVSITAGTGLTGGGTIASSRTLNVVGGTCITANANDIQVTDDSITDTQLAYNTGQHLTTTSSPQFSNMTLGEYSNPNYSNGEIGTSTFASGFVGTGWKMSKSGNEYNFETNNMLIRGTLSVYELLIQQVRATNGAIFVSSAAKVESSSGLSASDDDGTITFEDPSNNNLCPFAANDLIMMQRVNPGALVAKNAAGGATNVIKKLVYKVASVSGKTVTVENGGYNNTSSPSEGDDFVRIGNTSNSARQGIIYLTSDDSNSPYIDIKSDIDSYSDWTGSTPKVRLGKLDGITDSDAGLDGSQSELYGLYSDTVRLKGHIHATSGKIGGISMAASKLYTGTGTFNNSNTGIYLDSSSNFSLGNKLAWNNSTLAIDGSVTIGGSTASVVVSGAAAGATANQDSTSSIREGTTKANVGLGSVDNTSAADIQAGTTKANVGLSNVDNDSTSTIRATAAATAGTVAGWTITSNKITGSTTSGNEITMQSDGNIYTDNWSINRDGSASFANNSITFATNGDITSNTYLIERTRLFGGGEDGVVRLHTQAGDGNSGSTNQDSWYGVDNADGTRVLLNQGQVGGNGAHWYQSGDIYATDFTVRNGTVLYPRGYRIFCKGTLTVESGAAIYNHGSTASGQSGGAGGIGGNLSAGTAGANGGNGGIGTEGVENKGGYGGGAGGSGGMILISARYISNSGTIAANGGDGANGASGSS